MDPILKIENLTTTFPGSVSGTEVKAVTGVSLDVHAGEIVGLVGESGCGKSTIGRTIVGLERRKSGRILFDGVDLATLAGRRLRETRRQIQYVFQDPYASLNDRQTIGQALREALLIAGERSASRRDRRVEELLDQVGLRTDLVDRYARELSGGQRQRVAIARALAVEPRVLICDEPVSALDLSIRAQIMNLFLKLQHELGMACLFIAHDLSLVRQAATRVFVMYLGRIAETGPSDAVYSDPRHPYTRALLSAVPIPDPRIERTRERIVLEGEIPSPTNPPSGCSFRTRCPMAREECALDVPSLSGIGPGHFAACILAERRPELVA